MTSFTIVPEHVDPVGHAADLIAAELLAELERAERRSQDMRFSSALRAAASQRAANLRRRIAR